jgi:hypothetical protein
LKNSGVKDWQELVLNMLNPDLDNKAVEVMSKLLADDSLSEKKKIERFTRLTGLSRRTFFRYKKLLTDAGHGDADMTAP